ncbi:hypothetical protein BU17DRAFT_83978 [Hysterangium stoloniferum]|nr:hypothetical protein BU17DRAFT_83978 [Hysterangium stoloniferum]
MSYREPELMNRYPAYQPFSGYTPYGPPNGYAAYYGAPGNPGNPYAYPPAPVPYAQGGTQPRTRTRRGSDSQGAPYREPQFQEARGRPAPQTQRARTTRQAENIPKATRQNGYPAHSERTYGGPDLDYLFVSLSSHDTLKISCLTAAEVLNNLQEKLSRVWPSAWTDSAAQSGESILRLGGDVWGASGQVGLRARKFVMNLFVLLAQELKAPRLVFTTTTPDPNPCYFMISFSMTRRTVQIIYAPDKIRKQITTSLLASVRRFPEQSEASQRPTERTVEKGVIEVITSATGGGVDLTQTMPGILRMISLEGWHLEANIAFGKAGLFGMRGRREAWLFRQNLDYHLLKARTQRR